MIVQRHNTETQSRPTSADSLLRDIAFVLRMTRKVKSDMLAEPASKAANDRQPASPEHVVCAV